MRNWTTIRASLASAALVLALLSGCRNVEAPPSTTTNRDGSPYDHLSIELASSQFSAIGQTAQLKVVGVEESGRRVDLTSKPQTKYSTSKSSVAVVSTSGLVRSVGAGQANIYVVYNYGTGLLRAHRTVSVTPGGGLESLGVDPSSITFTTVDQQVQLTVTGRYTGGATADLTTSATGTTYASGDAAIAAVTGDGLVTPVGNGLTTVTVANAGVSASINVLTRIEGANPTSQLTAIVVQPGEISFHNFHQTQQLQVLGTFRNVDSNGNISEQTLDITSAQKGTTYRSSSPAVAMVSANGLVTALLASGSAETTITAANSGIEGEAHVLFLADGSGQNGGGGGGGGGTENAQTWVNRDQPLPRNGHALAFDSTRNVAVLFGGYDDGIRGDTWEWSGTAEQWTQVANNGPSPRYAHTMAFDSLRGVSVLVGGTDGQTQSDQTWEWNGQTWRQAAAGGIPSLSSHAMAYDSVRGVCVVFGGEANGDTLSGSTWEWNGTTWKEAADGGPRPRLGAAMAFDATRGVTVLFGGDTDGGGAETGKGSTLNGETWEWDGQTWTQVDVEGPSPRLGHAMAYDSISGRIVLQGGQTDAGFSSETWVYDGAKWTLLFMTAPSGRVAHAMAFDTVRNETILFGGYSDMRSNIGETWLLRQDRWVLAADSVRPTARRRHVMTYDDVRGVTVLFAGFDGNYSDETWEWNGRRWTQRTPQVSPSARSSSAMTFNNADGSCIVFGGSTGNGLSNATWSWDGNDWTNVFSGGPSARQGHCMAYDPQRSRVVLFGGNDGRLKGDTWEWNGSKWARVSTTGPAARADATMIYDPVTKNVILFGGFSDTALSDVWSWDGAAWTQIAGSGPAARTGHATVFDDKMGVLILFGGLVNQNASNDTWVWNGTNWVAPVFATAPTGRYNHAMAFDRRRGVTVLFGGYNGPVLNDTWELVHPQ